MYSNAELVDTILVDLNDLLRQEMAGQYIQACGTASQMAQKLINLRTAIDRDIKSRDQCIEDLKQQLRAAGMDIIEINAEE